MATQYRTTLDVAVDVGDVAYQVIELVKVRMSTGTVRFNVAGYASDDSLVRTRTETVTLTAGQLATFANQVITLAHNRGVLGAGTDSAVDVPDPE